jgi:hypothetical protein
VGGGPHAGDLAGHVLGVLDRDRHPEQRPVVAGPPPGVGLLGVGQRALVGHRAERVQLGIVALDPLEVELDELARGDVTPADQVRLPGGPGEGELVAVHAGNLSARLTGTRPGSGCA